MKNSLSKSIINFFFPNKCARCKQPSRAALCEDCMESLRVLDLGRCRGCGKAPERCVCKKNRHYKRCISAFDFNSRGAAPLIYKLKSNGNKIVCRFLSTALTERIKKEYADINFNFITYVPISRSKLFTKGFDHAHLLARELSRELSIPLIRPPIKRVRSANQKFQTGKGRKENATTAFILKKNVVLCGNVLLIDDVMTSGATVYRCAEILKQAGADEVYCATAATV